MDFVVNFPLFLIIMSLLSAVISTILPGKAARILSRCLFITGVIFNAVLLAYMNERGGVVYFKMGEFGHPWGNELKFGVLEPLLMMFFSGTMLLSTMGGQRYLDLVTKDGKENYYYVMTNLMHAAFIVLIYTDDIFTGYVFVEICTLASCGILCMRGSGHSIAAATRYMIFSLIGSSLFLVGAVLLYSITGHLLFPEMKAAVAAIWEAGTYRVPLLGIITLICVGLGIKGGMFPFHFWMPDTYGNALPGSASILSGLVCKGYILLMIRIIFCGIGTEVFYESQADIILFLFGAAGMIVGSLSAIKQSGINRMLAYSSAAQIGYVFLGIGISATAGMTAAIFQILAHAISKPLLFITAAQFREGCGGSKDFRDLQGVALKQRISGLGFTCGAMSLVGIPLFAGFVAKFELVKAGSFTRGKLMIVLLALGISTLLNVLYFLRTVMRVYSRPEKDIYTERIKFTVRDYFPVLAMLAVNIYMGVHAQPILDIISRGLSLL